ncbi:MAG TPA: FHA domain-containing protein [Phototrophicaceae bacterium]|nr:FHA domain-containing protein [Phototrophicaceae bacterium]
MQDFKIGVVVMSGIEDGKTLKYYSGKGHGLAENSRWIISIGRQDTNDICLTNDNYISRVHAKLHQINGQWWLEDCSRNGTFVTPESDFFRDSRVDKLDPLELGQLFRVGRTWLRLQALE